MSELTNTVDVVGDEALTASIIDGSVTEIVDELIVKVKNYAFYGNTSLKAIRFANASTLGQNCFQNATSLETVELPNVTTGNSYEFRNCTSLRSIKLTKIYTISSAMFTGCTSLEKVDLYSNCYAINDGAFSSCSSLTALILRRSSLVTLYGNTPLHGTPIASGTGYIYVPAALVDSYKTASNWSTYANQFRALEEYTVDGTITGELDETKI